MADPRSLDFILGAKNLAEKELVATQQRVQQMGAAVTRLNQEFRSGAIGPEVFTQQLSVLRREATRLAPLTKGLAGSELNQLEQILGKTSTTTGAAGTSLNKLRAPLQALALQMTATSGAGGRLGATLLTLGAGAGVTIAVSAAAAILAAGWRFATKEINAATDGANKLADSFRSQAESARTAGERIKGAFQEIEQGREKILARAPAIIRFAEQIYLRDLAEVLLRREITQAEEAGVQVALQARAARAAQAEQEERNRRKRFEDMLTDVQLELASVGKTAQQVYVLQLRRQKLTETEIEQLVHLRALRLERAYEFKLMQDQAAWIRVNGGVLQPAPADRTRLRGAIQPGKPGSTVQRAAQEQLEAGGRGPGVGEELVGGIASGIGETAEEMKRLAGEMDGTVGGAARRLGRNFGAAFEAAVTGAQSVGKALKQGTIGALADVARAKSRYYAAEALGALAGAFFPKFNPAGLWAAAKYGAAAAAMGMVAGGLSGGGGGGGGVGGGGGDSPTRDRAGDAGGSVDTRPIVFQLTIAGERSSETVYRQAYDMARHRNLGGRPPGVGSTEIRVPAGLVIARGVG